MPTVNFELRDVPLPMASSSMSAKELAMIDSREMTAALHGIFFTCATFCGNAIFQPIT
jgi:hypothetical protein